MQVGFIDLSRPVDHNVFLSSWLYEAGGNAVLFCLGGGEGRVSDRASKRKFGQWNYSSNVTESCSDEIWFQSFEPFGHIVFLPSWSHETRGIAVCFLGWGGAPGVLIEPLGENSINRKFQWWNSVSIDFMFSCQVCYMKTLKKGRKRGNCCLFFGEEGVLIKQNWVNQIFRATRSPQSFTDAIRHLSISVNQSVTTLFAKFFSETGQVLSVF